MQIIRNKNILILGRISKPLYKVSQYLRFRKPDSMLINLEPLFVQKVFVISDTIFIFMFISIHCMHFETESRSKNSHKNNLCGSFLNLRKSSK